MAYQPQRLPQMVAGASPVASKNSSGPVLDQYSDKAPSLRQLFGPLGIPGARLEGELPSSWDKFVGPRNYPGEPPGRSYTVDPGVPPSAFHDYIRRQHPDMMEKFWEKQAWSGEGFGNTIEQLARKYHAILADPDPLNQKREKLLFDLELQEAFGKPDPGEYDI